MLKNLLGKKKPRCVKIVLSIFLIWSMCGTARPQVAYEFQQNETQDADARPTQSSVSLCRG